LLINIPRCKDIV